MECEVCGRDCERLLQALIEGARLAVCERCAKSGRVVAMPQQVSPQQVSAKRVQALREAEISPDCAERIKNARERMRIGRDVLAELTNEKESYLRRIEAGDATPTEELARRLEKALGITLIEQAADEAGTAAYKTKATTLADIANVKRKG
jgi:putative transcription factor